VETFGSSRRCESLVVHDERNGLAQFTLQIQTAGKLDRISGSERVLLHERPSVCRNRSGQLDNRQGTHVVAQGRQDPIALLGR
jgi:hypothetical protein